MSETQPNTSGLEGEYDTLHEFIKAAKMRTHPDAWDYLTGGTETETTLRRNRAALDRIALRPRVLRDVSSIGATATFLGRRVRLPVMIGPVGGLSGDEAVACKAAGAVLAGAGPRILRAETAPVVALTTLMYEAGQLAAPDHSRS